MFIFGIETNSISHRKSRCMSKWYHISRRQFEQNGGSGMLRYYSSLGEALQAIYPDHPWQASKFEFKPATIVNSRPHGFWKNKNNQRQLFEQIAATLQLETLDDWYKVSRHQVEELPGGKSVLKHYASLGEALQQLYPEHVWQPSRFPKQPGWWEDIHNQRAFLDRIRQELAIQKQDDWCIVTRTEIERRGGSSLFQRYKSLDEALQAVYPQHPWNLSRLGKETTSIAKAPPGHWVNVENQREFLDRVGAELGVKQLDDWYRVTRTEVERRGGKALFCYYKSLGEALQACYPHHSWKLENFPKQPGFWENIENQRAFLESIGRKLSITQLDEWYGVSQAEIHKRGGSGLLRYYNSLGDALQAIFPQHAWQPSRFLAKSTSAPRGFWLDTNNLLEELDRAAEKLGIKQLEDWYSVTLVDLKGVGFAPTITKTKFVQLLQAKYPGHPWNLVALLQGKYAQQKRLEKEIRSLFEGAEIKINARKEAGLVNPETGEYLEVDIYIPALRLAFEYQDLHHYRSTHYAYQPLGLLRQRDNIKKKLAIEKGINLVSIPCWWDRSRESLIATIKNARPELLNNFDSKRAEPIPEAMPAHFLQQLSVSNSFIEDIGEPMNACFMTLTDVDPKSWWLFEKYDGIRAFWNPKKKAFYSRFGRPFRIPQNIVDTMPADAFLDGELWFGRDTFQEAMKIANRVDLEEVDWNKLKYMVFDIPNHKGTYAERYEELTQSLGATKPLSVEIAPKEVCTDIGHLEKLLQDIIDNGGEGIILRNPDSLYQPGRSRGFLKLKTARDSEAKIVGCSADLNVYECLLPNGIIFTASPGTMEFVRKWKPKIGDIVSFKYRGFLLGSKKPKMPSLHRLRPDLSWQDVIRHFEEKKHNRQTGSTVKLRKRTKKQKGYWKNRHNLRSFFCEIANESGFDPLIPENWSNITQATIRKKGGGSILDAFGSYKKAVAHAFPELSFDANTWSSSTAGSQQIKREKKTRKLL